MSTQAEIPNYKPVQSSMLDGVAFDEDKWTLTVCFKSGMVICYQQVPPETFEELLTAESVGKFYNANIKGKFESLVIREKAEKPLVIDGKPSNGDADLAVTAKDAERISDAIQAENQQPATEEGLVEAELVRQEFQTCYVHMGVEKHWQLPDGSWVCIKCHPKPSELPQERETALAKAPQVLPPLEAPKTAAEAIALLSQTEGLIQATIKANRDLATQALTVQVTDAKTYTTAGEWLKRLTEYKDRATRFLDPIRAILLKPYQTAQTRLKEATTPLDESMYQLKQRRLIWESEQERIRRAEEDRLRREAEARAEEERRARGEQLTLGAVDEALANGDTATAEKLIAAPIEAPYEYVAPSFVESNVPKTDGISRRAKWAFEITNFEDLVLDIASGICNLRDGKPLGGHAPVSFLKPNDTAIRDAAKAQQKSWSYPGVKVWNEGTEAVRRKK